MHAFSVCACVYVYVCMFVCLCVSLRMRVFVMPSFCKKKDPIEDAGENSSLLGTGKRPLGIRSFFKTKCPGKTGV